MFTGDACGYVCNAGFFKHPVSRLCVRCRSGCAPGLSLTGSCRAPGATSDLTCEACGVADLPDGAHFTHHCDWECGENHYRPRGQSTCVECTSECTPGHFLRGRAAVQVDPRLTPG